MPKKALLPCLGNRGFMEGVLFAFEARLFQIAT
jgi:hypothetical protein